MFEFCIATYMHFARIASRTKPRANEFYFPRVQVSSLVSWASVVLRNTLYIAAPRAYTYLLAVRGKARGCRVKTRNTRMYGPARSNRATGISSRFLRRLKRRRHFVPLAVRLLLKLPSRVPFSADVIHILGLQRRRQRCRYNANGNDKHLAIGELFSRPRIFT